MKKDIHPTYYSDAKISCACGAIFTIGSTIKEISVEICSQCHPFYTGKEKLVDTAGRVDRFKKIKELQKKTSQTRKGKAVKKARSAKKKLEKEEERIKQEIKGNDALAPKTTVKNKAKAPVKKSKVSTQGKKPAK